MESQKDVERTRAGEVPTHVRVVSPVVGRREHVGHGGLVHVHKFRSHDLGQRCVVGSEFVDAKDVLRTTAPDLI